MRKMCETPEQTKANGRQEHTVRDDDDVFRNLYKTGRKKTEY